MKRTRRVASGQESDSVESDSVDADSAGSAVEGTAEEGKWRKALRFLWALLQAIEYGIFPPYLLCASVCGRRTAQCPCFR